MLENGVALLPVGFSFTGTKVVKSSNSPRFAAELAFNNLCASKGKSNGQQ
jgi:hypothetical protein